MEVDDESSSSDTCDGSSDGYFVSYEDLEIHRLMLMDSPRNKSYREAIFNNRDEIDGKTVLDVGAGTGILSVFCAQAGARKVYAVEASHTYKIAEETAKENGFQNVIKVIHGRIEDIPESEIPEKVDIIVSEWMGFYLFHEGMLGSVITARDRFLKPGGMMFPESATLYSSPCSVPSVFEEWKNVDGVSMTYFASKLREQLCKKPLTETITSDAILSEPEVVTWIDLRDVTKDDVKEIRLRHIAVSNKDGNYQGICLWFACTFPSPTVTNTLEPITLSTEPGEPATHWKQTIIVLPMEMKVETGSPICYDVNLKQSETNSRRYTLEVTMLDPSEVEHPEFCSCHLTKCILVRAMLERYERGDSQLLTE